jgi:G3E family GTPase
MTPQDQIPVGVITGFLGSGKTTLLSRLLKHPKMSRSAVIINEFGEVGLDHDFVAAATDDTILMEGGCICCTVRSDMIDTLRSLFLRRLHGEVPPFERVLIETTGLADPAPILHTLMADPLVATRYRLDSVVATVDAVNGDGQLDRHPESVKQVAVADRLLLTKTDLIADPASRRDLDRLKQRLKRLNPAAPVHETVNGEIDPDLLFGAGLYNPETKSPDVARWLKEEAYAAARDHDHGHDHGHDEHHHHDSHAHRHDSGIRAYCIYRDRPLTWGTWVGWLEALIATRGADILRMKGLLNVVGLDAPVAVHGVQHLFHPPVMLPAWPSDDRRSRLVFITQNIGEDAVRMMLDAWAGAAEPTAS